MENHQAHHAYAPRIYFIDPLLVGPLANWPAQFEHAAALGFDHVLIGSPFMPGSNGHREAGTQVLDIFSEWKSLYIDYSGKLQKAQIDTHE